MDPVSIFATAANILQTGSTLFNSYAGLKANKEQANSAIKNLKYKAKKLELDVAFDKKNHEEATREYADICSYKIDEVRKEQQLGRQQLGYNMLRSGIAITDNDSAGLLLRMTATDDEMRARSVEASMYHERPRLKINPMALNLTREYTRNTISDVGSALPWANMATIASGVSNLASIYQGR